MSIKNPSCSQVVCESSATAVYSQDINEELTPRFVLQILARELKHWTSAACSICDDYLVFVFTVTRSSVIFNIKHCILLEQDSSQAGRHARRPTNSVSGLHTLLTINIIQNALMPITVGVRQWRPQTMMTKNITCWNMSNDVVNMVSS